MRTDALPNLQSKSEVPEASHYDANYLGPHAVRLTSYNMQVRLCLEVKPSRVLIVGKGDGIVQKILEVCRVEVRTLDIEETVRPDVVASVLEMPVADGAFDAVLCCQVLEHLPFSSFDTAVRELARTCRRRVVLSVPDQRRYAAMALTLGARTLGFGLSLGASRRRGLAKARYEEMGHHWEIGVNGVGARSVIASLESVFAGVTKVRNKDLPWHTFFICEK